MLERYLTCCPELLEKVSQSIFYRQVQGAELRRIVLNSVRVAGDKDPFSVQVPFSVHIQTRKLEKRDDLYLILVNGPTLDHEIESSGWLVVADVGDGMSRVESRS